MACRSPGRGLGPRVLLGIGRGFSEDVLGWSGILSGLSSGSLGMSWDFLGVLLILFPQKVLWGCRRNVLGSSQDLSEGSQRISWGVPRALRIFPRVLWGCPRIVLGPSQDLP